MNIIEKIGLITTIAILVLYIAFWIYDKKKLSKNAAAKADQATLPLQLQAYERLVILADRIALPNLISRVPAGDMNLQQYQRLLIDTIRQEFDYNVSQQLYVTMPIWEAVNNLKEQNIYIIHQVGQTLMADASGNELSKRIMDLLQQDPNVFLHPIVLDALRFEAKKLMH